MKERGGRERDISSNMQSNVFKYMISLAKRQAYFICLEVILVTYCIYLMGGRERECERERERDRERERELTSGCDDIQWRCMKYLRYMALNKTYK